jgi:hypothetical protein
MTTIEIWMERLRKGNWIDPKIKPPIVGKKYIVLSQEGVVNVASISNSNTWYDWQIAFEYDTITHYIECEQVMDY